MTCYNRTQVSGVFESTDANQVSTIFIVATQIYNVATELYIVATELYSVATDLYSVAPVSSTQLQMRWHV